MAREPPNKAPTLAEAAFENVIAEGMVATLEELHEQLSVIAQMPKDVDARNALALAARAVKWAHWLERGAELGSSPEFEKVSLEGRRNIAVALQTLHGLSRTTTHDTRISKNGRLLLIEHELQGRHERHDVGTPDDTVVDEVIDRIHSFGWPDLTHEQKDRLRPAIKLAIESGPTAKPLHTIAAVLGLGASAEARAQARRRAKRSAGS